MKNGNTMLKLVVFFAATATIAAIGTGCAMAVHDEKQERTLDGVKLIAPGIEDREDPSSFEQARYELAPDRRLLLRYETLSESAKEVRTEGGRKVEVLLAPETASDLSAVQASVKICPLKRNWMMAATWRRAHPFSPEGYWSTAGGDFDPGECISGSSATAGFVVFDATPWFLNYVRGRDQNFGLILVSDRNVAIAGDANGSFSPRIRWVTTTQDPYYYPSPSPSPSGT
jgi:hypothetical protein